MTGADSGTDRDQPTPMKVPVEGGWLSSPQRQSLIRLSLGISLLITVVIAIWAGLLFTQGRAYDRAREDADARRQAATQALSNADADASAARATVSSSYETAASVSAAQEELRAANARIDSARSDRDEAEADYRQAQDQVTSMSTRWLIFEGAAIAALLLLPITIAYLRSEKRREHENRQILADLEVRAESRDNPFDLGARWLDNQEQLQNYHQLVLNYASSTRQTTLATLVAGFAFLAILGIFAVSAKDAPSAIASSVVTAAAAAVTGYIARAVLRNADTSSREMLSFFSHPLEVQRLLAAEKVAQAMPEPSKNQANLLIIGALTGQSSELATALNAHDSEGAAQRTNGLGGWFRRWRD